VRRLDHTLTLCRACNRALRRTQMGPDA
jgi:hypothetical protein